MCPDPRFLRRHVKTRRSIDAITIKQRHRRHVQIGAGRDQVLGQRSAFEKAESGAGMKLDVHKKKHSAISTQ
jgi:hypothetical protein